MLVNVFDQPAVTKVLPNHPLQSQSRAVDAKQGAFDQILLKGHEENPYQGIESPMHALQRFYILTCIPCLFSCQKDFSNETWPNHMLPLPQQLKVPSSDCRGWGAGSGKQPSSDFWFP